MKTLNLTFAVKIWKEPFVSIDLESSCGMAEWRRQTKEMNWPRFKESPTNIILFPRRVSSMSVALKRGK